jgi:hypothetical protein
MRDMSVLPDLQGALAKRDFIVDGLIARNSLSLLVGSPSCGKTAISLHLAKCLTTGSPFLGMATKVLGRCLFLQFDMDEAQQISYNASFAPDCPIRFIVGNSPSNGSKPLSLMDKATVDELCQWCKEDVYEVVFIDTLSTAFPGLDENSNTQMTMAMGVLRRMTQYGLSVIAMHHVSKGEFGGYSQTTRGASSLTGCTDSELKLAEVSRGIELRATKVRNGERGVKGLYKIEDGRIVEILEDDSGSDVERLMAFIASVGMNEVPRKVIVDKAKIGFHQLQQALSDAVNMGLLKKEKRGRADVYIKLNNDEISVDNHPLIM